VARIAALLEVTGRTGFSACPLNYPGEQSLRHSASAREHAEPDNRRVTETPERAKYFNL